MKQKIYYHLVAISGLPIRLWSWIQYYYSKIALQTPLRLYHGEQQSTGLWCICAIYQPRYVSANLLAYLSCLHAAGYNIIAVHNGESAPNLPNMLSPFCHTVMIRSPGGRDLGSYKAATAWLAQRAPQEDIRHVIYCNDSVFVAPENLSRFLSALRGMDDPYIGLVETFKYHYHVGSWFFAVSGKVFNSDYFQTFWKDYIPISHRAHGVINGEVALTRCLIRNGISPRILFSAKNVIGHLFSMDKTELAEALIMFSTQPIYKTMKREGLMRPFPNGVVEWGALEQMMMTLSSVEAVMDVFQLFLLKYCDFPFIKKDNVYRNVCHCIQLQRAVEQWSASDARQLDEIMGFFRFRGALRWRGFVRRLLVAWGVG